MNHLYLVRHGENPANLTKEFSYQRVDYSLTPKGVLQAQQTAEYFKQVPVDRIYASPLKRTHETAQIISEPLHRTVLPLETLREVNVGDFEGQPVSMELWARHNAIIGAWMGGDARRCFPGGEDFLTLCARFRASVAQMVGEEDEQHLIAVGHGGVFTFAIQELCPEVNIAELCQMENHNCSITRVDVTLDHGRLVGCLVEWASIAHLHGAAADLVSGALHPERAPQQAG
jgi:2,3-bisphosphoglycerate-dependent phosphoglycerate mutase